MKHMILVLLAGLFATAALSSCAAQDSSAETGARLAFPGTEWGMTPQDVLDAYDLAAGEVVFSSAPQLFSGTEDAFYAAYALECAETREVLGADAVLTFYFADMVLADTPVAPLGLIYVEARFPEAPMETYDALEAQLDSLAQRDADARIPTTWESAEMLTSLEAGEAARQYFELRSLDAETELSEPLVSLYLFGEMAEGPEDPGASIRWYGLNAALAAYLEENEDPAHAFAQG